MAIEKRGPLQYRVRIRKNGVNVSKTFETMKDAKDYEALIRAEVRQGVFVDRSELERTTLAEVIDRYIDEIADTLKSAYTVTSRLKRWLKHPLARRRLSTLNGADFSKFARERKKAGISTGTILQDISVIQAVLNACITEWNIPADSSFLKPIIKKLPPAPARERRLAVGEEEALLAAAKEYSTSNDLHNMIVLALETGMRRSEIFKLEWEQIDFATHVIKLRSGETKNNEGRHVGMSAKAEALLNSLPRPLKGGGVFTHYALVGSISDGFYDLCKKIGIEDLRFHDLRHEAASRFAPHMPVAVLAKTMGWKSLQMAMRYYNPTASDIATAVRNAETARLSA